MLLFGIFHSPTEDQDPRDRCLLYLLAVGESSLSHWSKTRPFKDCFSQPHTAFSVNRVARQVQFAQGVGRDPAPVIST